MIWLGITYTISKTINTDDVAANWLREGAAKDKGAKQPIDQQAHALSMVANLAAQQEESLEQLVIG